MADQIDLARAFVEAERFDRAVPMLRALLSAQPHHEEALYLLSICETDSGDAHAALDLVERALRERPQRVHSHVIRSNALWRLGHTRESLAAVRTALWLDPTDLAAHRQLVYSMMYAEVSDRALMRAADRLVELAPLLSSSFVARGHAFLATRRTRRAEESFLEALRLDPHDRFALEGLASVKGRQSQFGSSVALLSSAVAVHPDDQTILTSLRIGVVAAVLRWEVSLWITWALLFLGTFFAQGGALLGAQIGVVVASLVFTATFWWRFRLSTGRWFVPVMRQVRSQDRFLLVILGVALVAWGVCFAIPFLSGADRTTLHSTAGWILFAATALTGFRWTLK